MCSPAPLLKEEDGREKEDGTSSLPLPFLPLPPRNIRCKEKGGKTNVSISSFSFFSPSSREI